MQSETMDKRRSKYQANNKIDLDKYYTPTHIAEYCINKTYDVIYYSCSTIGTSYEVKDVIEPSAGNGSFSLLIENFFKGVTACTSYDIAPEHELVQQADFLKLDLEYKPGRLFIGNPPFGRSNTGSVKFYNRCCELGDWIAFILPISQLNNTFSLYKFDLVYSEELPVIEYSGRKINTCFNIYRRPEGGKLNKKPNYSLNEVDVFTADRDDVMCKPSNYCILNWGTPIGKRIEHGQYASEIHFYIPDLKLRSIILSHLDSLSYNDWRQIATGETGRYSATPTLNCWRVQKYLKETFPNLLSYKYNQ